MSYSDWEAVIGLEVHAQLSSESKIFSTDSTKFGGSDNSCVSSVSLGMPGALPVLNEKAVALSIKLGLALNCTIRETSVFARKNYFYPDLPKGYQISQFDKPLCEAGYVEFYDEGVLKKVGITRAHMEEDAGKSTHYGSYTLINLNRAGIPLLEIVSEPDMRTPSEAAAYARNIRQIVCYLGVCDGNLEEGSMRCDCNVSIRENGNEELGVKVEIKNINSFRFIEKAIDYEIQRQKNCMAVGEPIVQQTRLYDSAKNITVAMRSKEQAHDYRYFPDPDLQPLVVDSSWIESLRAQLPELPLAKVKRFQEEYKMSEYDSFVLTQEKALADFFEDMVKCHNNPKAAANWVTGDLQRELKESKKEVFQSTITPEALANLIRLIDDGVISGKMAKSVFIAMWSGKGSAEEIIEEKGMKQISNPEDLVVIIEAVLQKHPKQVEQYQQGKDKLFGFFVGQVMKETKGQANPDLVNKLLIEKLA